nr:hypothetical protein BaRGS_024960 [Batillaria attramentaria]
MVLEQRPDGLWKGYVVQEGRMAKTGLFPSNHVVLVDSQALKVQHTKTPQVPDLLTGRAPHYQHNGHIPAHNGYAHSDTTSCSSSSTDDSFPPPPYITSALGPPPHIAGYHHSSGYPGPPPHSPGYYTSAGAPPHLNSPAHSAGGSAPPSSPGYVPGSPAVPCSPHKEFYEGNSANHSPSPYHSQHTQFFGCKPVGAHTHVGLPGGGDQHAEWAGPVPGAGPGGDMRASSPGKDHIHNHSPASSNRNSAASSDSGRGFSTGHIEPKVVTVIGQHRLSGQSYESGVSSRQSYHSTSSSSLGSLDRLEESGHASTINVQQLIQAGVPDKEVLHAWLHDLHFEEYYANFVQAGYDMPTISRMTPEDLTAIGITKPAHRKRLKAEIARLHISDGIPDFCPHDMMEWLHLLGLGMYHETLAGQGYDNIEYVTDITWEDLEEIGIKRLGHQKKIMLAIDRLKRITSGTKRLSAIEPRRSSIEMLEPPPPAPPIGRWSGEIAALPPHMYEGGLGVGAKPKKSPSGDSISTTGSGGSGSNSSQGSGGEIRAIPLPREDAGIAGAMPYSRQNSSSSNSGGYQTDVVAIQVKRQGRSSTSEETKEVSGGPPVIYQSFQGTMGKGGPADFPMPNPMSTSDPGAFASCVKSLSERFGKKSEIEGSQESLSSDSDEFPPPPPPIAMDIITPKIHNYGIPSKTDVPPTIRDYSMHELQIPHQMLVVVVMYKSQVLNDLQSPARNRPTSRSLPNNSNVPQSVSSRSHSNDINNSNNNSNTRHNSHSDNNSNNPSSNSPNSRPHQLKRIKLSQQLKEQEQGLKRGHRVMC